MPVVPVVLLLMQLASATSGGTSPPVVSGQGSPTVTIPRVEETVEVDGRLDEAVWSRAARLGGFSQYRPVDGRPAEQPTEVLVWYSPSALHFGIVAHDDDPSSLRATLADRDNLDQEDTVTIFLDTFSDQRRAFFFTVNALGVQQDGVQSEGSFNAGMIRGGPQADKNPDYLFDSKGHVTGEGYVVEVRIPFKSLRYPGNGPQRWGLNVLRKVQRTGYEDTWTDVRRANSSFLAQSGGIDGLHDMKRGIVTEIQPFVTTAINGAEGADGGFTRESADVEPGVNLRLASTNLSFDFTVNPDFSQVESDAAQVTVNERFALFYPEKRPFFLEGIELFTTPNQLVYTRQIANPIGGAKLSGKMGPLNVAYLAAKEKDESGGALFNIARVRGDLGAGSTVGVTVTDKSEPGSAFSRVLAADTRLLFRRMYFVQLQGGGSWTGDGTDTRTSPLWMIELDRTGRAFGFNYKITGIGPDFEARSGYVPRNDNVEARAFNRFSWYGERGAALETVTTFVNFDRLWRYDAFGRDAALEGYEQVNAQTQWRGGWNATGSLRRAFVRFEAEDYADYTVAGEAGPAPYQPLDDVRGVTPSVGFRTPVFRVFYGQLDVERGPLPIFAEGAAGRETRTTASANVRPTGSIRVETSYTYSRITRDRDDSEFARTAISRLKVEYQAARALFFRVVGEYRAERQAALVGALDGQPLYIDGAPRPAEDTGTFRVDFLTSYRPTPGTIAFFGYGSSLAADHLAAATGLERVSDGFFVKLAYQFRR